jgi:hypothetical protein
MASLSLTKKFRMSAGGRAWRVVEVTHVGAAANSSISAAQMDLSYIEAIAGVHTNMAVQAAAGSILAGMLDISISANHKNLVWVASTVAATQTITAIGW